MKKTRLLTICCLMYLPAILGVHSLYATSAIPIGIIYFSYDDENIPPFIIPLGGEYLGAPACGVVYDDRAVEISFYCSNGAADAELCDGDIVVGTWHKPSGTQTMTIRLPVLPRVYTIYLYLQNGVTLQGEYTVE